jgi:hypothetical protein
MVGCCLLRSQYVVVAWSRSRLLVGRRSSCPFLTLHLAPSSIRAASCAAAGGGGPCPERVGCLGYDTNFHVRKYGKK